MSLTDHLLADRLICPDCRSPLSGPRADGSNQCEGCRRAIHSDKGIRNLLPLNVHHSWEAIEHRDIPVFDEIAQRYNRFTAFTGARRVIADWSLTKIEEVNFRSCRGLVEGKAVLEIGCGRGALTRKLAPLAAAMAAMDISEGSLRYAEGLGNLPPEVLVLQANVYSIPFLDETFDVVVASEVLEHLPGLEKAMEEIRRVVKRGGWVVASVPNALMFLYPIPLLYHLIRRERRQWLFALLRREVDDTPQLYHRPFLPTAFKRLFVENGFQLISHATAMFYFWRWPYDKLILWADARWRMVEHVVRLLIEATDFLLDHRFPIIRWWGTRQFIVAQKV